MPNEEVNIVEYNPDWKSQFVQISDELMPYLEEYAATIEHVGSTSVPELMAKPIIDVDVILETHSSLEEVKKILQSLGYEYLSYSNKYEMFVKYAPVKHHLFVTTKGSMMLENHLKFRDHLKESTTDREEYANLKRNLAQDRKYDIKRYTMGKSDFVNGVLKSYSSVPAFRSKSSIGIYSASQKRSASPIEHYGAPQIKSVSLIEKVKKIFIKILTSVVRKVKRLITT